MTRKECIKRDDTVFIGGLSATKECLGENTGIFRIAIAGIGRARVDASRVGVEDLKVGAHNRLASINIENLEVVVNG